MECVLKIGPPTYSLPKIFPSHGHSYKNSRFLPKINNGNRRKDCVWLSSSRSSTFRAVGSAPRDVHGPCSSLGSRFCYDKPIPEEIIEKPVGLSLAEKNVGENPPCQICQAKGAILCSTCSGSGLYVDSILESQGIIVKVRCLGCGGTGNTMCSVCGGRGHT